ncbi:MAG: M56 family metallopeptidase [Bryobacteraceae bacterium]|nr:M56 family metallopeptidase [Bryobacteraceae bacterium]
MESASRILVTFLINALWQAPLLALLAWCAARLLSRAPASYRYAVWAAALLGSVLLPLASFAPHRALTASYALPTPSPAIASHEALTGGPRVLPVDSDGPRTIPVTPSWGTSVLIVYSLLLLYRGVRAGRALAYARGLKLRSVPPGSVALRAAWDQAQSAIGGGEARLLVSRDVAGPVSLGHTVVAPEWFERESRPELLAAALGHELAHVARRDFHFNCLFEAVYAVLACHPAAWYMRRQLERTREMACDEQVSRQLLAPSAYARSIVEIAAVACASPQPRLALGVCDGDQLEERVHRLLAARPALRRARLLLSAALAGVAVVAVGASTLALRARAQAPDGVAMLRGRAALEQGDFARAASEFAKAVEREPANVQARLSLAHTQARWYRASGAREPGLLVRARNEYQRVLDFDAASTAAHAGLLAIAIDRKEFADAHRWAQKLTALDPLEKTAWYTLGVIEWSMAYPDAVRAQQASGDRPETGRISDPALRRGFRDKHGRRLDEGMRALERALSIDAGYSDALAYMNLLQRLKAMAAEQAAEAAVHLAAADDYVQRALKAKRAAPAGSADSQIAPPPPPPPPPPNPGAALQNASELPPPAGVLASPGAAPGAYWQVAGAKPVQALELFRRLKSTGFPAMMHRSGADEHVRVVVGPYFDDGSHRAAKAALERAGFRAVHEWK